ncbi:MAG: hypothetical protein NWE84_00400 [Candidatus Bathyarchaeota archaeon]|nr:hypothetical protein [Candidatus Bathyarchaeota archaeon]
MRAEEETERSHGLKDILERILSEDKVVQKLAGFIKSHPIYAITVIENIVQGFIDFAGKSQT